MNKNITLSIHEAILRKAKYAALEHDQSLSQWVTGLIAKVVSRETNFQSAKKKALKQLESGFHLGGAVLKRDELHER